MYARKYRKNMSRRLATLLLAGAALALATVAQAGPKIQSWTTGNGAQVLFVAAPELPMVDLRVVFDAGSARDDGTPGLASLTNALLSEGAGAWDADQIAERLDEVGAELGSGSLRDMAWMSVRSLTEPKALDTALETLSAILTKPTFPAGALERLRQATLVGLRQSEQNPGSVGRKAFFREVYGDHPYATDPEGTVASVQALTREEVVAYYKRYYVAKNAVVAIVGALDRPAAEKLAERLVGALPAGEHAPALPDVKPLEKARTRRIAFPSSQTHIYAGQPGIRRGDPDYFPLFVGNHILGGSGLVSLLSEEVREKRGLSYSVSSYFLLMRKPGPFLAGLQTKNSQADEALKVMMETIHRFVQEGPTDKQLEAAKQNITGGFPLRISSNKKIVEYLAMIGFYGLPLDYLDRFTGRVEAVTKEQIRDAFRRHLHPDGFVTVIVGPEASAPPDTKKMPPSVAPRG